MWGETTRVENRGVTTRGKRPGGKRLGGETSCYRRNDQGAKRLEFDRNDPDSKIIIYFIYLFFIFFYLNIQDERKL